ncbi:Peptidase family S41 [Tenacibaculum sp. MAR_2009_124]|uniref:S41 family peptidase n=1 Tax=Tenacibaculum sp. MAR_2009_124 TaxID=1250059 RepID=UPI0008996632|nr:S41 family peptidase [Tenacibaculum sp. MAR_2009_124]SEC18531.1 Peptidase family S41 [Tenacibaculum sp. MAR_2009_124]
MIKELVKSLSMLVVVIMTVQFSMFSQSKMVNDWLTDIDVYHKNLEEKHIDLYKNISKEEFEQELSSIKRGLHVKNQMDIITDLMRLTRRVGDGHTSVSLSAIKKHVFPFELYRVNGEWRVVKAISKYKHLLGKRLFKIRGINVGEVAKRVSEVAQFVENEHSKIVRTGQYMTISELLLNLDVIDNYQRIELTFLNDSNHELEVVVEAIDSGDYYKREKEVLERKAIGVKRPSDAKHNFLWYSSLESLSAVYIRFESYPSFDEMKAFGATVLGYIQKNKTKRLIIDLRNNGGGDFFVGTFLAYYLNLADSIDWKSGVYVLTDKVTFSAATSNASQYRHMLNAKIVGEPTGSNPTGYQDMGQFILPNSKLVMTYSKRLFRFQEAITEGVQPDQVIHYEWKSYSKGEDNMLEWIFNDIREEIGK